MEPYWRRLLLQATGSSAIPARFRTSLLNRLGASFENDAVIHAGATFGGLRIRTGRRLFINRGFYFDGADRLEIAADVSFGPYVKIITASHSVEDPSRRCSPTATSAPVSIGAGVWIGAGAMVLPGVTVARGCVIGAGSVVTRDTQEHGLYAGVPARRLRDLSPHGPSTGV